MIRLLMFSHQVLVFPPDSLISEFGGALGLFLGFSFLDFLTTASSLLQKIFCKVAKSLE